MSERKIHAGGKVYAPDEFVCEWCKTPLVLDTYYTIDGKNVCQSCRNKERCAKCGFLITETKYVTLDDKLFHPDCFRCTDCLVELTGKFHVEKDDLLCADCLMLRQADNPEDLCPKGSTPNGGSRGAPGGGLVDTSGVRGAGGPGSGSGGYGSGGPGSGSGGYG